MKRLLFLALAALPLWGAHAPILSALTSSQAAFRYNRPDTTVCTWAVSTSPSYSPLIPDLIITSDSGPLNTRWWVLGQNTALTASTMYYWQQTCGSEVYTGNFVTLAAPAQNPNQWFYSAGGHPLANKLQLQYGATPALGNSVTVDCAPGCLATISWPSDTVVFHRAAYLNQTDVVAVGEIRVATVR